MNVGAIQPGGMHTHAHAIGRRFRRRIDLADFQHFRPAGSGDDNSAHSGTRHTKVTLVKSIGNVRGLAQIPSP